MAVEFSQLPIEEPFDGSMPSKLGWGIAFAVMAAIGAGAVLLLWPKSMPTNSWQFWATLVIFPIGIPGFIVLRRFSSYEGAKLDAELRNQTAREFNERVFSAAAIPLGLAGAAYRYSADKKENAIGAVQQGSVVLKTQVPFASDAEPVKARWLTVPEMKTESGSKNDDFVRSRQVTSWLLVELLDELLPRVQVLPESMPLVVHLLVENGRSYAQNKRLLEEHWYAKLGRFLNIAPEADSLTDLASLDAWMDQLLEKDSMYATLLVAIQLHPLLAGSPPADAAEAGAALLLIPDALADQHKVSRIANLHRPVRGAVAQPADALPVALRWAGVSGEQIKGGWRTGLDAGRVGALRESAIKLGLTARAIDVDQTIGHGGITAPWLALACAASALANDETEQLVFVAQGEQLTCAVMKPYQVLHA